jgi:hypothetical protein
LTPSKARKPSIGVEFVEELMEEIGPKMMMMKIVPLLDILLPLLQ